MFQNGISRNTKCAVRDSFRRDSHILPHYASIMCLPIMLTYYYADIFDTHLSYKQPLLCHDKF